MEWDDEVDARGLRCPLPVLRARKRLQALPDGGLLLLWTDDPMALIDVPHFCAEAGHCIVESREMPEGTLFLLRKGPAGRRPA